LPSKSGVAQDGRRVARNVGEEAAPMARIRTIKPEMWKDDRFIDLSSDTARLFFIGLLNHVDDEGRAPYSPREIRREIFPDRVDLDVAPLLDELAHIGLAILYSVDGKRYLAIRNFGKHQRIDRKTLSKIPAPPDHLLPQLDEHSTSEQRALDESSTGPRDAVDEPSATEGNGREGIKEGKGPEPDQGTEGETNTSAPVLLDPDSDEVPEGLDPAQYARGFLEKICLPTSRPLLDVVRSSIETLARSDRISPAKATVKILDRARAAKARGETISRFWFEDGRFNSDAPPPDRHGGGKARISPDSPKPPDYYKSGNQIPDWMME
jgi:hypothetical protein